MIITLKGANFSTNKIGTLSTWTITPVIDSGSTYSGSRSVNKGSSFSATLTLKSGYAYSDGITVTMSGGGTVSKSTSGSVTTFSCSNVTGDITIKALTYNTSTGESGSTGGGTVTPSTPVTDGFVLTSSVLKNQTYSTSLGDWNSSTKHLATDFLELKAGYDVVFDLPDGWQGYLGHVYKGSGDSGSYTPTKTSILSGWVTKGTISTGASLDRYFIVVQKTDKTAISPSDYDSIEGSIQVKKPDARTVTIDSSALNVGKNYKELNIVEMETRLATWYYALTPGSTISGTIATGLKAYIISIRDGETTFAVDTEWVSSFNQTYDTACSVMIVVKKEDGSAFTDTSAWTSPVTINIK